MILKIMMKKMKKTMKKMKNKRIKINSNKFIFNEGRGCKARSRASQSLIELLTEMRFNSNHTNMPGTNPIIKIIFANLC